MLNGNWRRLINLLLLLLLVLLPLLLREQQFYMHFAIRAVYYAILTLGLWLIMTVGQVSFAHASFMAIGGYASALLVRDLGLSFWVSLPLSGVVAGIVAIVIGYPALRLKGAYFFVVSTAFGEITKLVFSAMDVPFGGTGGIVDIPRPGAIHLGGLTIEFASKVANYYLVLALFFLTLSVFYGIWRSRIGMTLKAIQERDILAESIGVNIMVYKVGIFGIACFFAGLAGSFYTHYLSYIYPGQSGIWPSMDILIMTVIGGRGSIAGPIVGAVFLPILGELLRQLGLYFDVMGYAALLISVMLLMPGGLVELPEKLALLVRKFSRRAATSTT